MDEAGMVLHQSSACDCGCGSDGDCGCGCSCCGPALEKTPIEGEVEQLAPVEGEVERSLVELRTV